MATFVDVPTASGEVKTKAVCRIWRDGKQVNKCKTFLSRSDAEAWAVDIERAMKEKLAEEQLEALRPADRNQNPEDLETLGDVNRVFAMALTRLNSMDSESFLLVSVNTLVRYFEKRIKAGASEAEVGLEADLLYSMFRYRDQVTGKREANLVQMALTALRTRGLMN